MIRISPSAFLCSSLRPLRTALALLPLAAAGTLATSAAAQVAIKAKSVITMGPGGTIADGVVVITGGKVSAIGPAASTAVPEGFKVLEAAVAIPGLIDAHSTAGLSGIFNQRHDSDQLERSAPIQPELRALDAYNPKEKLVEYVRSLGVTTLNTGHAPGELISGQMMVVKTTGNSVAEALVKNPSALAATFSPAAEKDGAKSPGTRAKMMAMLRAEFIKAQEYQTKWDRHAEKQGKFERGEPVKPDAPAEGEKKDGAKPDDKGPPTPPERSLRLETLVSVLKGELPLLITANRAQDIDAVLRLAAEFKIKVWLDGAAEAHMVVDQIKAAGIPVIVHASTQRAYGDTQNQSMENAAILRKAGITIAIQSGYEGYVPKTRVVLLEAALAAANGLSREQALAAITIDAATILGIQARVGSLEVGKDGDVAMYDGDPFEYATHCTGVVIDGKVVSEIKR
ncbi:MAG: amidohydrolase family protein [Phycisphaerales bacterium]